MYFTFAFIYCAVSKRRTRAHRWGGGKGRAFFEGAAGDFRDGRRNLYFAQGRAARERSARRVTGGGISTFMSRRQSLSRQLLTAAIAAGSVTRQSDLQFLKAEFPICDTDGGAATRTSRKPKTRLIPPAECVVADSRQWRRQRCPPQRSAADERARLDLCDGRRRIDLCQRGALFKCVHLYFLLWLGDGNSLHILAFAEGGLPDGPSAIRNRDAAYRGLWKALFIDLRIRQREENRDYFWKPSLAADCSGVSLFGRAPLAFNLPASGRILITSGWSCTRRPATDGELNASLPMRAQSRYFMPASSILLLELPLSCAADCFAGSLRLSCGGTWSTRARASGKCLRSLFWHWAPGLFPGSSRAPRRRAASSRAWRRSASGAWKPGRSRRKQSTQSEPKKAVCFKCWRRYSRVDAGVRSADTRYELADWVASNQLANGRLVFTNLLFSSKPSGSSPAYCPDFRKEKQRILHARVSFRQIARANAFFTSIIWRCMRRRALHLLKTQKIWKFEKKDLISPESEEDLKHFPIKVGCPVVFWYASEQVETIWAPLCLCGCCSHRFSWSGLRSSLPRGRRSLGNPKGSPAHLPFFLYISWFPL